MGDRARERELGGGKMRLMVVVVVKVHRLAGLNDQDVEKFCSIPASLAFSVSIHSPLMLIDLSCILTGSLLLSIQKSVKSF